MTRVLFIHRYGSGGSPQDQQRGSVYEPLFREAGIDVRYVARYPLWALGWGSSRANAALRLRSGLGPRARRLARGAIDRVGDARILRLARESDVVVLVKVTSPSLVRAIKRTTRARVVYDLADATVAERTDAAALAEVLATTDAVTVDNSRGAAYAKRYNPNVFTWPPLAYVERFDERRAQSRRGKDGRLVAGWIGTPSTASNLFLVLEALEDASRRHADLDVRLVGIPSDHELLACFERVRATSRLAYDRDSMVDEVLGMDIGLFPVFDNESAAMRGVTKGLIYLAGGAVPVCSPVGEIPTVVRHGENGMLAAGREAWGTALDALVADPALRSRLATAGVASVRAEHSLEACFAQLRAALRV